MSARSSVYSTTIAAAALLGLSACSLPSETASEAAAEVSQPMSTGEVLHVLHTINRGEIEHAQLALDTSEDPRVLETAERILEDHEASNERISAVAEFTGTSLQDNTLSKGLQMQASAILGDLEEMSGAEFDREFLQRQVELHDIALDTVTNELMPNASSPEVRQLLEGAVPRLENHLQEAAEQHASLEGTS